MNESSEQSTARIIADAATATARAVAEAAQAAAVLVAKENGIILTTIAVLQTEVTILKSQVNDLNPKFDLIAKKLDEISIGRPSWAVTTIITLLSCTCVGLLTYVITLV